MPLHNFNLRMLAEDLVRVRRPDDRERYAASQRQARIDPNPHQIDAVIFALRRLREGGCILADEVGLGKTIEAGLVIAQSRAEGAQRILLIIPKSLIGQWQNELLHLFGIEAREGQSNFVAPGVYVVGREFAGSERGASRGPCRPRCSPTLTSALAPVWLDSVEVDARPNRARDRCRRIAAARSEKA